uniref:Kinesin motor domain-containing protein n=1 Tax=Ascaris lumbricoides TaxID=6252 RepID=A0A0M3IL73_ASCLU
MGRCVEGIVGSCKTATCMNLARSGYDRSDDIGMVTVVFKILQLYCEVSGFSSRWDLTFCLRCSTNSRRSIERLYLDRSAFFAILGREIDVEWKSDDRPADFMLK